MKYKNLNNYAFPDKEGRFGEFGGKYVSETLITALEELEKVYAKVKKDKSFQEEVIKDLNDFVGRPSPLYFAERWTKKLGGAKIYLKREDLNHTGAHKINNTVGQVLLAKKWVKKESLLKLAQVNMELQLRLSQLGMDWNVLFSWAKKILKDKRSMYIE